MPDLRLQKLRYRAWRRGFREADLILGAFADGHLDQLDAAELDAFERLLDQPDHEVYGWIIGRDPAPEAFQGRLLERIRTFHVSLSAARGDDLGA